MKRLILSLGCIAALFLTAASCRQARLEPGGAYTSSITNAAGTVTTTADLALYNADTAFEASYKTLDMVFLIERNNRDYFWKISPAIKHTLDKVRTSAQQVVNDYAAARTAYLANPTPAGLTGLQAVLAQLQQVVFAANAVIAQNGQPFPTNSVPTIKTNAFNNYWELKQWYIGELNRHVANMDRILAERN